MGLEVSSALLQPGKIRLNDINTRNQHE